MFNLKRMAALSLVAGALLVGCATTKQARETEKSGFLGDYSLLQKGGKDEALMVYVNPKYAQTCHHYKKVLIEPITIWTGEDSQIRNVSEKDRQLLVNYLHKHLADELRKYYTIVREPQPETLKIRAALTEAEGSWVVLDTVSSIVPQMLIVSQLKNLATGTAAFVGKAGAEVEVVDAVTGERMLAGVDRRVGQKSWSGMASKWDDVEQAYNIWAQKMAERMRNCGAGPNIEE